MTRFLVAAALAAVGYQLYAIKTGKVPAFSQLTRGAGRHLALTPRRVNRINRNSPLIFAPPLRNGASRDQRRKDSGMNEPHFASGMSPFVARLIRRVEAAEAERDAAIRRAGVAETDADALAAAIDSGAHWGCTCPWDEEGNPSGHGGEHYPMCKRGQPLTGAAALVAHAKAVAERGQP